MSDRDEKGRKTLDWQELKGPFSAMKATFDDGLQFHVYADNTLYLCRRDGPYDNVDLGAFQDPLAKAEEIAATLSPPVEPPVLPLLPKNDAEAEAMGWTRADGDPFYRPAQPSEPPVLSRAEKALSEIRGVMASTQYSNILNDKETAAVRAILESLSQEDV